MRIPALFIHAPCMTALFHQFLPCRLQPYLYRYSFLNYTGMSSLISPCIPVITDTTRECILFISFNSILCPLYQLFKASIASKRASPARRCNFLQPRQAGVKKHPVRLTKIIQPQLPLRLFPVPAASAPADSEIRTLRALYSSRQ